LYRPWNGRGSALDFPRKPKETQGSLGGLGADLWAIPWRTFLGDSPRDPMGSGVPPYWPLAHNLVQPGDLNWATGPHRQSGQAKLGPTWQPDIPPTGATVPKVGPRGGPPGGSPGGISLGDPPGGSYWGTPLRVPLGDPPGGSPMGCLGGSRGGSPRAPTGIPRASSGGSNPLRGPLGNPLGGSLLGSLSGSPGIAFSVLGVLIDA
jgi:hypothetical protein